MNKRVTVITGASSGIGLAAAKFFKDKGDIVFGISRRTCPESGVRSLTADITSESAVQNAIDSIVLKEGKIDVLICNAGFGISGAVEFTEMSDAKKQFDVNVFGTMNCIKAALPHMRERGRGHIIVTSSVAGALAIPFQAYYSATKAALNSLVLALANEVRSYGVKVAAVLPGDIKTGFTDARIKSDQGADSYSALQKSVATMEHDERNGMPPIAIAKRMYALSKQKNPKPVSSVGIQYSACCLLGKILPSRLSNWIVGKMYANG
ncbi:MAG: SDR family oxidoreductase [Christensenellaceae bacterium]|nr:SDR family oxidoreductase [Christensenellaceae bacterium]